MVRKLTVWIIVIIMAALCSFLGYRLHTLSEAHAALIKERDATNRRADLLQHKYVEQKAQAAAMQRAKLAAEGLTRQAEQKIHELSAQLKQQTAEMATIEKKVGAKVIALETRIKEKDDAIEKWREKLDALTESYRQAQKTVKQRDRKIADMEEDLRQLQSDLQFASRTRDRYHSENQKMANTAKSILARYDEKGVFATSILKVEPFTQIKKVELEKLIQAYLDKIDDQTIRDEE